MIYAMHILNELIHNMQMNDSCRLWLFVESESHRLIKRERSAEEIIGNAIAEDDGVEEELSTKFKDWTLTALWLETVLEAKPQAVIQTMFLIERILATSNATISGVFFMLDNNEL